MANEDYSDYELIRSDESTTGDIIEHTLEIIREPTVANALTTVYRKTLETMAYCEEQQTARKIIETRSNETIAQINAQRDFLMEYLNRTFDERKYQFDHYFKALDKAIEANSIEMMSMCLQNINNLALSSPFRPLLEAQRYYRELAEGKGKLDF